MTKNGSEKRKFNRVPLQMMVQYRLDTFDSFISEYSLNVSEGGMFIETTSPRPEGSYVYLQFQLKDGTKIIEGIGQVVRVNKPEDITNPNMKAGMGIEFVNLDEDSVKLIQKILSERES